jgi:1-deoxy-D-xylulose-5-phosphate reductoisomerase
MKLPIQYALFYPDRMPLRVPRKRADFYTLKSLTFEEPDMETFTGLPLALRAGRTGGSLPTVYNAANERAVALFLEGRIGFLEIVELIEKAMDHHKVVENPDVDQILAAESETYEYLEGLY